MTVAKARRLHSASPASSKNRTPLRSIGVSLALGAAFGCCYLFEALDLPLLPRLYNDSEDRAKWSQVPTVVSKKQSRKRLREKREAIESKEEEIARSAQREASIDNDESQKECVTFAARFAAARASIASTEWAAFGDSIADLIVPTWVRLLPDYITKLQVELSMAPGSLADVIWQEAQDPEINPEIEWDASVRISGDLCDDEKTFLRRRKKHTTQALARYLGIPEKEVHPEDVPTIAMCGSGGGLRALVAGTASYLSTQEAGLFDCVTYTAGVSGSCWLQTLYFSSLGKRRYDALVDHLKARIGVHIAFPPAALGLLATAPTNKFLLSGFVEKLRANPEADFGLVDIYGMLLAARLLVPKGELAVDDRDLKLSNQRAYIDQGQNPLPIYAAVRHEIPLDEEISKKSDYETAKEQAKREAWFQWFEFTPYELWCEELEAGIPAWAVGRKFHNGRNVRQEDGVVVPEMRIPQLLGIWGSAFCATLSHYYKEIRPIVKSITGLGGVDGLIEERNDDLIRVHPIDPATIPNYALGLKDRLPPTCPESIFNSEYLQLMDAGMSNNLPIYPLLRPGRDVEVLIAFDASADIKTENWLRIADGYARQRGIRGWPLGAGWPAEDASTEQTVQELNAAEGSTVEEAAQGVAKAQEKQRREASSGGDMSTKPEKRRQATKDLGHCTVWVGTTEERSSSTEPPAPKIVEEDWELMKPDAGISVIYFPLLPNPKVEGVDPSTSDFMSTWNFVYTPDDVEKVIALARANFEEGREQTKRTVRAVYERKKATRLKRWADEKAERRKRLMRLGLIGKVGAGGDHGDHFS
ncbi:MAG: hypothetical protein M1819_007462 [Sarea resinae]|nr:MAG: hypothetical protein M1819_007462 [Sarea resinae]